MSDSDIIVCASCGAPNVLTAEQLDAIEAAATSDRLSSELREAALAVWRRAQDIDHWRSDDEVAEALVPVLRDTLRVTGERSDSGLDGGECLMCGHRMLLAIWSPRDPNVGVCFACRQAAEPLRGPCSHARGCLCPCPYPFHENDHCIGCHGHNRAWGAGWDPRTNEWDHPHDHDGEIAGEALRVGRMEVSAARTTDSQDGGKG